MSSAVLATTETALPPELVSGAHAPCAPHVHGSQLGPKWPAGQPPHALSPSPLPEVPAAQHASPTASTVTLSAASFVGSAPPPHVAKAPWIGLHAASAAHQPHGPSAAHAPHERAAEQ